ncbi:hypothetical protein H5A33_11890 [Pectobacterium brasiliense]|uniref:hypothetical protein n=1 Tax=Pectobacterium brasiliense TaxID=180957 RepID=UPI00196914CE|nr:hypothetical protein [Pectobacterium brasiliense]MBN3255325.1 hypothetical protein [Pectobacterium brasiliense]
MTDKKVTQKELKQLVNFLEEFSWISKKFSRSNFIDVVEQAYDKIRDLNEININPKKDDMKGFLVGYLPRILLDKELFLKNKDIDDFARTLGIEISRPEKRSREEMIGIIVCDVHDKSISELEKAYDVIDSMSSNPLILNKIKEKKTLSNSQNEAYDWNDVIKDIFNKD